MAWLRLRETEKCVPNSIASQNDLPKAFIKTSYRRGEDPVLSPTLTRLEAANIRLREIGQAWSEKQVLQRFISSLPAKYGSALDSLGMGIEIELKRADAVSRVWVK